MYMYTYIYTYTYVYIYIQYMFTDVCNRSTSIEALDKSTAEMWAQAPGKPSGPVNLHLGHIAGCPIQKLEKIGENPGKS